MILINKLKKMKTQKLVTIFKGLSLSIVAAMLVIMLGSCATKAVFLSSAVVPAAKGDVKVKKDGNNNYSVKLQISNLAESSQLTPPKKAYIVWLVGTDQRIHNIGLINSSSGFWSKNLKASFETVSSFKPTRIFLTAENEENVNYPRSEVVLTTADF
jgi:hypothetical protein